MTEEDILAVIKNAPINERILLLKSTVSAWLENEIARYCYIKNAFSSKIIIDGKFCEVMLVIRCEDYEGGWSNA